MRSLGVFTTDQYEVPYQSVKQRREDLSFLLNVILVDILQEYAAHPVFPDIFIQGTGLYATDPTEVIIQKDLFRHYQSLDGYIRHLRSQLSDKLITVVYHLHRDRRYSLFIDYVFINAVTTLITFNFVRKSPA